MRIGLGEGGFRRVAVVVVCREGDHVVRFEVGDGERPGADRIEVGVGALGRGADLEDLEDGVRVDVVRCDGDVRAVDLDHLIERVSGIAVLNGSTNFDFTTKTYKDGPVTAVSNLDLNIEANIPLSGKHANYLVIVADSDGDPKTIESFIPKQLANWLPGKGSDLD